jgi:hypothetical protein
MMIRLNRRLSHDAPIQTRTTSSGVLGSGLPAAWSLGITCIVAAHLLQAHGAAAEWPLVETLHQGIMAHWNDGVMLTLVGWPNSLAVAAELWTAGERSLPMLLVPRQQPRTPGFAHVATRRIRPRWPVSRSATQVDCLAARRKNAPTWPAWGVGRRIRGRYANKKK